jgi:peptidoglycan/LPS O-acetylase OafA/YrhL
MGLLLYPLYKYLKQKTGVFALRNSPFTIIIPIGIAIASLSYLVLSDIMGFYSSSNRNLQRGIPSLLLVMALVFMEHYINGNNRYIKFMVLVGEASYTMYLFHYHIIAFLSRVVFPKIFPKIGANNVSVELLKLVFAITATITISLYIYKLVDKPIQKGLRKLLLK